MKVVALETENPSLEALVDMAAEEAVIITRDNNPAFALIALDEDDIQTWGLGQNPDFLALMKRSWERLRTEGSVSLAEARRRLLTET